MPGMGGGGRAARKQKSKSKKSGRKSSGSSAKRKQQETGRALGAKAAKSSMEPQTMDEFQLPPELQKMFEKQRGRG